MLGAKPSDLEWPLSSDSEAPTFPTSVMSPLKTAGSISILARGLPGVVPCCSRLPGAAELRLDWDLDPTLARVLAQQGDSEATRMRIGRVSRTTLAASSNGPIAREVIGREEVVVRSGAPLPAGFEGDEGGGVDPRARSPETSSEQVPTGERLLRSLGESPTAWRPSAAFPPQRPRG